MNQTEIELIAGLFLSILTAAVGYGQLIRQVKDLHERRKEDLKEIKEDIASVSKRVESAEAAVKGLSEIANAVERMGERFSAEIRHLVDRMGIQNDHVEKQLTELKEAVKDRRRAQ